MAYEFQSEGWQDWNGERYDETPPVDPTSVMGIFVHFYADGSDYFDGPDEWFWVRTDTEFKTWDEWYDFIVEFAEHEYLISMA